jgi:DNA-directed RNA polymerase subunit RPC12/RpoP
MYEMRLDTRSSQAVTGDEQNAMAIAAMRQGAQPASGLPAGMGDHCPYCGRKSLAIAASTWGAGRLSHGICAECGTEIVQFTAADEPLALPWMVPAMCSSVA